MHAWASLQVSVICTHLGVDVCMEAVYRIIIIDQVIASDGSHNTRECNELCLNNICLPKEKCTPFQKAHSMMRDFL